MTCPTCGFQNTPGSAFCVNCGSRLASTPPPAPDAAPNQHDHAARVYDAPDDSMAAIPDGEPPAPQAPARSRFGRTYLLAIGGSLLVLLILCVALTVAARNFNFNLGFDAGLRNVGTAKAIADDSTPVDMASRFTTEDPVYITYSVDSAEAGDRLSVRVFHGGEFFDRGQQDFVEDGSYNAYFELPAPLEPGAYRAELTYKDSTKTVEWEVTE